MHIRYNSGKNAYETTVYKYETRTDDAAYEKATKECQADRRAGQTRIQYPNRDHYAYVQEMNLAGDSVTFFTPQYPHYTKIPSAYQTGRRLNTQEIVNINLTKDNCEYACRGIQAHAFKEAGYHGPIGGGEARGLRNLFNETGQTDLVRRGYFEVHKTVTRPPTKYQIRRAQWNNQPAPPKRQVKVDMLQYCYVFKSPIPSVPFEKFVKLARMYKSDKGGLRKAVTAVMANPEAHNEVETIDAIDMLSKMVGMD